jgi:hypothetical protein
VINFLTNVSVIRNQFCNIDVSVFVADFSNSQDYKYGNTEVNEVSNDVEVHDYFRLTFRVLIHLKIPVFVYFLP